MASIIVGRSRAWESRAEMGDHAEADIARNLHRRLIERGTQMPIALTVVGAGVHWHVDVSQGSRCCRIHCFNYGAADGAFLLGIRGNTHLSKVDVGLRPPLREGAEYFLEFWSEERKCATGRTQDVDLTQLAAHYWVAGSVSLDSLFALYPFVDWRRRRLREVMAAVNECFASTASRSRAELDGADSAQEDCELWTYAGERSSRIELGDGALITVALFLHRTQLAKVENISLADGARIVARWVDAKMGTKLLGRDLSSLSIAPFASEFERGEFSAWHWGNVWLQSAHDSVLATHRPILDLVMSQPALARFFSFTSLNRLCFSRSSLYPFDCAGLPIVVPLGSDSNESMFGVGLEDRMHFSGTAHQVVDALQCAIGSDARSPYFGCIEDLLPGLINPELARRGSHLRAQSVQQRQWSRVRVRADDGRCCILGSDRSNPTEKMRVEFPGAKALGPGPVVEGTIAKVADAIIAWAAGA